MPKEKQEVSGADTAEGKKQTLQFANPDVNAKYETDRTEDVKIVFTGYHGKLSRITAKHAEYLVSVKDPNIRMKATPANV